VLTEVNDMRSIVIYGSRSGNTERIATVIAETLRAAGTVRLLTADEAPAVLDERVDLVVVGGPTEGHKMTEPVTKFFDRLAPGAFAGALGAAFDTRIRLPRWLSGSAAAGISRRLRRAGARLVAPEESFFVTKQPALEAGEVERAAAWAASLAGTARTDDPAR
jgi:flavodoxin